MPSLMTIAGVSLVVAGVGLYYMSNRYYAGYHWSWWVGVGLAIFGGHLWFFSGMPRDQIVSWLKSETFAFTLALLIRWPFAEPYRIPSGSMEPTLHGDDRIFRGDRVFVNKWIYGVRFPFINKRIWYGQKPQRWDIVVFKSVEKDTVHRTLVKRIVGLPGERIEVKNGRVYADGTPLEIPDSLPEGQVYATPYRMPAPLTRPFNEIPWQAKPMIFGIRPEDEYALVPQGHYLVMGDNSRNSRDGRYFGWMPNEHLVGRVACIWWPPARWRDFTGFSATWWWRSIVAVVAVLCFVRLLAGRSWAVLGPGGKGVDHLFINFVSYGLRIPCTRWWLIQWGRPKHGDLVLYRPRSEAAPRNTFLIGRIAGLPGEKVSIVDGKLQVDGVLVEEAEWGAAGGYGSQDPNAFYGRSKSKNYSKVPEGKYFILSDKTDEPQDSDASDEQDLLDSRVLGWISHAEFIGRAMAVWWPPTRWRRIAK